MFDLQLFQYRLDDQIRTGKPGQGGYGLDIGLAVSGIGLGHAAFCHRPLQHTINKLHRISGCRLILVIHNHLYAGAGRYLGDTTSHRTGADYPHMNRVKAKIFHPQTCSQLVLICEIISFDYFIINIIIFQL